jgi:hypothetical protein
MSAKEQFEEFGFAMVQPPHFISLDRGDVDMEWCFGDQGAVDSWRVSLTVSAAKPSEAWLLLTSREFQYNWTESDDILKEIGGDRVNPWPILVKLLTHAADGGGVPSLDMASKLATEAMSESVASAGF